MKKQYINKNDDPAGDNKPSSENNKSDKEDLKKYPSFDKYSDKKSSDRPFSRENFKDSAKSDSYKRDRPSSSGNRQGKFGNERRESGRPGGRPDFSGRDSKAFNKNDSYGKRESSGFQKDDAYRRRSDSDRKDDTRPARNTGGSRENREGSSFRKDSSGFRRDDKYASGFKRGDRESTGFRRESSSDRRESFNPDKDRSEASKSGYSKEGFTGKRTFSHNNSGFGNQRYGKTQRPRIKRYSDKPAEGRFRSPDDEIRLNRYLSISGICSRRQADQYITEGLVSVNGVPVTELGVKVKLGDVVKFNGETIKAEKKVYLLLNKPKDYITSAKDTQGRKTVYDLIHGACPERVFPVGRLDRNSMGVILMTNDGELAAKLSHPKYLKKKIYHVHLDKNLKPSDMEQIQNGIELEDGLIKADEISYSNPPKKDEVGIEIHSGKNRIVRRIFEHLGYNVLKLDRVLFAGLTKKNLPRGKWRFLSEKEVNLLKMNAFE
jgi:23S rRNA pseudouridine2605 synthase